MSFGAPSANAILALNLGARRGGFAHDARRHGGDIILQAASGCFGCRTPDGGFSLERFAELTVLA